MPTYDYRCSEGHITEEIQPFTVKEISCESCGKIAERVILTAPGIAMLRMGVDPAFPSAADRWARVHRQETDKARKKEMEFEREVGRKPSWYDKEVQ